MDFLSTSVSFAAGIVVGVLITKAMEQSKTGEVLNKEKLLEDCFGEHMYIGSFSLAQAKNWIKARKESLSRGANAIIMKITPENLKKLNIEAKLDNNVDNYLVIAIVNTQSNNMEDSILIKYDELEDKLEDLLAKGDGTLVVNG